MNFEDIDGAEVNGDALPPISMLWMSDTIAPSDANKQFDWITDAKASAVVIDDKIATKIVASIVKIIDETLVLGDQLFKKQLLLREDDLTIAGGIQQTFKIQVKTVVDTLSATDFRSLTQLKKLNETLTIFDEFIKSLSAGGVKTKILTENISLLVVSAQRKLNIVIATKELTIYDQDRTFSYNIRCNEALTYFSEFIAGINLKPPPIRKVTMEDDIKIFNLFLKKQFFRSQIDDLIATADDFPGWVIRLRLLLDTLGIADERISTRISSVKTILMSEALALDATFILRKLRIIQDNISVTDANRQTDFIVTASAPVALTFDAFIKTIISAGRVYAQITSEGITLADSTASWIYRHKEFIEGVTVTDAIANKSRVLMQLISELPAITDSLIKSFAARTLLSIQSDGIVMVDEERDVQYAYRRLDEPLTVPDAATKVVWSVRVPSDTLVLTDSTGQARIVSRAQAETLALTDQTIAYALRQKIFVETLALFDTLTQQQLQYRMMTDPTPITDEQLARLIRYRVASESAVLTDSQIAAVAKLRSFAESVTVQDGFISVKINRKVFADLIGISDEIIPNDIVYVVLNVRNTISAAPPPVLGVDTTINLGSTELDVIGH
jgi:hypothetical protein